MSRTTTRALAGLTLGMTLASHASAEIKEIGPGDDLGAAVNGLAPGDELVLSGGTYNLQSKFTISISGTSNAPILIRAREGEVPTITRPDANQNTINIESTAHVELRGLEVRGGSHGIRLRDSSFVTIRDCEIHDTEDVALSANYSGSSYEGIHIVGNNIHDTGGTGEGLYLGCNSNACQFFDSVIEFNWIHDTDASDVVQGDGIEIKEGSYNNVIRHNVIHDTNYPCILTYGTVGNGSRNVIEGNLMWGCGDHAIQSAADAIIQNNIILGAVQDGIRSQPHQDAEPGNLTIVHNTILQATRDAIRVDGAAGRVTIANNAVYAETGNALRVSGDLDGVVVSGNVGAGALQGVTGGVDTSGDVAVDLISANYSGDVPADVFPAENSKLIGAADATHVVSTDFNGTDRAGNLGAGAYRFDSTGNPGWALQAGIKEVSSNGGSGGSGGSGQGGAAGNGDAGDGHESGTGANDGANANNNSGGSSSAGDADQQGGSAAANDGGDDGGCTVAAISRSAGPTWPWLALGILVFCALVARRHQVPTAVRRCH